MTLFATTMLMAKTNKQYVVFDVDLHCQGCVAKVEKNIAYEKGVKDLVCDLDKKQVTITYDADKTNVETLQKAFAAIKKPAKVNTKATEALVKQKSGKDTVITDATTGATQSAAPTATKKK